MGGVAATVEAAVSYVVGNVTKVVGGDILDDALGLEKLGREVTRVGDQMVTVAKVLGGEYHDDAKKIAEAQTKVNAEVERYNSEVDKLASRINDLIAFHEIFKMASSNNLDRYVGLYGPHIDELIEQLKAMMKQLQDDYGFVIDMTHGTWLERIAASLTMVVGGIISDLGDIVKGEADSGTWKRIITVIVLVIVVLICWWNPAGWSAGTALVMLSLAMVNAIISLDGMYANGAVTGIIMGIFDTIFNDVLNLDDRVGSDFNKFDKDNEDYQEMIMYVQLAIALAQMYVGLTAEGAAPPEGGAEGAYLGESTTGFTPVSYTGSVASENIIGNADVIGKGGLGTTQAVTDATSYLGGLVEINKTNMQASTLVGVKFSTYSDIYKAFSTAKDINDVVEMNDQYNALKKKLEDDANAVNAALQSKYRKNFMKSYKDTAYFLQDQQEYLDRYLWSMTANNMYVDPYGTTPVANSRFTPDKGTRVMSFGFEEMFDENKQAGSKGYFNSIIYG